MIGIFDSGAGGITVARELRRLAPLSDLCFFADRKNAPYGTKSEKELIPLVKRDAEILYDMGAERIIMACCTASTVHESLPNWLKGITVPIIEPTARAAAKATKNGRVGVIATEATVRSSAFGRALLKHDSVRDILEVPAQPLVGMVESGVADGSVSDGDKIILRDILAPFRRGGYDTLILGCTHFPHLFGEISKILPGVNIISSSREGALEIVKEPLKKENGRIIYTESPKGREKRKELEKWENTEEAESTTRWQRSLQ